MRASDIQAISDIVDAALQKDIDTRATRIIADQELQIKGLQRSLETALKGDDGLVEVARHERTPKGTRELALKLAGQAHLDISDRAGRPAEKPYSVDDILNTARKFETFINGGFIASELPKTEGQAQ